MVNWDLAWYTATGRGRPVSLPRAHTQVRTLRREFPENPINCGYPLVILSIYQTSNNEETKA
jgi:hypothetical protein